MADLGSFLGGGSAPLLIPTNFRVEESQDFVSPYTGKVRIWAFGAGGSGGRRAQSGGPNFATGGGAGGTAFLETYDVTAGQIITCTLGAGAPATSLGTGIENGTAGGTTTVTSTGLSLTATGGQGGIASIPTANLAGGLGGVGSGGTASYTGGAGGSFIGAITSHNVATGGGGAGLFSAGGRGGNVEASSAGASATYATGGGGAIGRGGDINISTTSTVCRTGGGGAGDAEDGITSTSTNGGVGYLGDEFNYMAALAQGYTGFNGQVGAATTASDFGGGTGGVSATSTTGSLYLGGAGGNANTTSSNMFGRASVRAGGGGGTINYGTGQATGGKGGDGAVFIQYIEVA